MTVYLVGAGPGDPGLLTLRGAEVLAGAEVVVHDRLADPSLLDLAPAGAERLDVGKRPGGPVDQESINATLVEHGRAGRQVVRLKGGDPFVFGRGGEEASALASAGVDFEVVPGVSAAVAVPAYAGVPVTHRGLSTSFLVVTGHSAGELEEEVDWEAVARLRATVVVLMGVAHRADLSARLIGAGRPPETPVLAVSSGTRSGQRVLRTDLKGLGQAGLEPPATIVIGPVAGMDLEWFARSRPLLGRRVVVTRPRAQAPPLSKLLRSLGAEPVPVPVIAIDPPADGGRSLQAALAGIASFDWVVFTSANAVAPVMGRLRDARELRNAKVAAIGPGTADELARWSVAADLVPRTFVAEALLEEFPAPPGPGGSVLLPRAASARAVLPEGLRGAGWRVEVVEAYRTSKLRPPAPAIEAACAAEVITFTSSSSVEAFMDAVGDTVGDRSSPGLVACIGPVTADTARRRGLAVDIVAKVHTVEGLVEALRERLAPVGADRP